MQFSQIFKFKEMCYITAKRLIASRYFIFISQKYLVTAETDTAFSGYPFCIMNSQDEV